MSNSSNLVNEFNDIRESSGIPFTFESVNSRKNPLLLGKLHANNKVYKVSLIGVTDKSMVDVQTQVSVIQELALSILATAFQGQNEVVEGSLLLDESDVKSRLIQKIGEEESDFGNSEKAIMDDLVKAYSKEVRELPEISKKLISNKPQENVVIMDAMKAISGIFTKTIGESSSGVAGETKDTIDSNQIVPINKDEDEDFVDDPNISNNYPEINLIETDYSSGSDTEVSEIDEDDARDVEFERWLEERKKIAEECKQDFTEALRQYEESDEKIKAGFKRIDELLKEFDGISDKKTFSTDDGYMTDSETFDEECEDYSFSELLSDQEEAKNTRFEKWSQEMDEIADQLNRMGEEAFSLLQKSDEDKEAGIESIDERSEGVDEISDMKTPFTDDGYITSSETSDEESEDYSFSELLSDQEEASSAILDSENLDKIGIGLLIEEDSDSEDDRAPVGSQQQFTPINENPLKQNLTKKKTEKPQKKEKALPTSRKKEGISSSLEIRKKKRHRPHLVRKIKKVVKKIQDIRTKGYTV